MTLFDLEQAVTNDFYCIMDLFWENVGSDRNKVIDAVHKAKDTKALHRIITKYI